jgi:hypothetical protein
MYLNVYARTSKRSHRSVVCNLLWTLLLISERTDAAEIGITGLKWHEIRTDAAEIGITGLKWHGIKPIVHVVSCKSRQYTETNANKFQFVTKADWCRPFNCIDGLAKLAMCPN